MSCVADDGRQRVAVEALEFLAGQLHSGMRLESADSDQPRAGSSAEQKITLCGYKEDSYAHFVPLSFRLSLSLLERCTDLLVLDHLNADRY